MRSRIQLIGLVSLFFLELLLVLMVLPDQILLILASLVPFGGAFYSLIRCNTTQPVRDDNAPPNKIIPMPEEEQNRNETDSTPAEWTTTASIPEPDLAKALAVYNNAVPELFKSIVVYLNNTSEPMSETLLNLKTGITDFLSGIQKTREDFEGTSKLEDVHRCINLLRNHITEITSENNRSCLRFANEIDTLSVQMTSITDFLSSISDIAARVHVLSINASIEAARAGQHGRGFKVIANEIQKLAHETQSFVTTISETLDKTNSAFGSLKKSMKDNQEVIARQTSEDSSTYEEISQLLSNHLEDIKDLYRSVIEYVETVDIDITTLSPITMLHAIITQEIENLEKVWSDFGELIQNPDNTDDGTLSYFDETAAIEKIRSKLTTARELSALENTVRTLGLDASVSVRKNETTIEFF